MHHFNAAIVTAITAARNRERFMRDYLEYRRSAIAEGEKGPIREYVIVPGQDASRAELLARNLATQGIEVRRAEEPIKLAARTIPAGAYIVSNAQPTARMIRNLLDPKTEQSAEFIKKQEERRKMRLERSDLRHHRVEPADAVRRGDGHQSDARSRVKTTLVPSQYDAPMPARPLRGGEGRLPDAVGIRGGRAVGRCACGRAFASAASAARSRTTAGAIRSAPRSSATAENPADLNARLAALPSSTAPSWCRSIPRGSTRAPRSAATTWRALKAPKVLLVWDTPTQSLSAGWTRYALERRFGLASTAVRTSSLGRANFNDYDVIVLPSGNFAGTINDGRAQSHQGLAARRRHARHGRRGVTLGHRIQCRPAGYDDASQGWSAGYSAAQRCSGCRSGAVRCHRVPKPGEAFDYDKAIQPDRERPASQPGAILRVTLDTNHWLTAGNDGETQVMIEGNRVFAPLKLNSGRNVGVYATKDKLIASGLIWPDAQDILVQKAFLMHQPFGQGHVIAFAEEPNYRAFTEATMLLFMNAVMLGPGY